MREQACLSVYMHACARVHVSVRLCADAVTSCMHVCVYVFVHTCKWRLGNSFDYVIVVVILNDWVPFGLSLFAKSF